MVQYLVSYKHDGRGNRPICYHVFDAPAGASWRELQQIFDPRYHYNYLKFYSLGTEIKLQPGE